jgi:hypothetical protein
MSDFRFVVIDEVRRSTYKELAIIDSDTIQVADGVDESWCILDAQGASSTEEVLDVVHGRSKNAASFLGTIVVERRTRGIYELGGRAHGIEEAGHRKCVDEMLGV